MKSRIVVLLVALSALGPVALRADDLAAVQARMAQRLPAINQLKLDKAVGEGREGMLHGLKADLPAKDKAVVQAENDDRGKVYAAIAEKTGTNVAAVARQRAEQIAAASKPGIMLQKSDGTWYEKTK
ncbi:MAG: hypothetical protein BWZ02_01488 [Lentisphaerae bacterium ADurb.BinA184]|nr:MAG: hypothetical protein BWZ02_01488 [Lentisphaerae bacterium ADurb.BinA184]